MSDDSQRVKEETRLFHIGCADNKKLEWIYKRLKASRTVISPNLRNKFEAAYRQENQAWAEYELLSFELNPGFGCAIVADSYRKAEEIRDLFNAAGNEMGQELRERLDIAIENDVFVGAKERIEGWERYGSVQNRFNRSKRFG